ncbi:MAG: dockerin type I repeat-containing protein, partial [Myxococcales bacterium]|nr:dockerin type I repeat-containing protein [Myxococcales bacterium]
AALLWGGARTADAYEISLGETSGLVGETLTVPVYLTVENGESPASGIDVTVHVEDGPGVLTGASTTSVLDAMNGGVGPAMTSFYLDPCEDQSEITVHFVFGEPSQALGAGTYHVLDLELTSSVANGSGLLSLVTSAEVACLEQPYSTAVLTSEGPEQPSVVFADFAFGEVRFRFGMDPVDNLNEQLFSELVEEGNGYQIAIMMDVAPGVSVDEFEVVVQTSASNTLQLNTVFDGTAMTSLHGGDGPGDAGTSVVACGEGVLFVKRFFVINDDGEPNPEALGEGSHYVAYAFVWGNDVGSSELAFDQFNGSCGIETPTAASYDGDALTVVSESMEFEVVDRFIRGDTNNDLTIDMLDLSKLARYLYSGQPPYCLSEADANDDGVVDQDDIEYLFDYLYDGGLAPPEPFSTPGYDVDCSLPSTE